MKRSKQLFTFLTVSAVILVSVMLFGSARTKAASSAIFEVSSAEGYAGDTIKVTVSIKENPGLAGLVFKLRYDSSALSVVSATKSTEALESSPVIQADAADAAGSYVGYSFAEAQDFKGIGAVLVVEFKVTDKAAVGSVKVELADLDVSNFDGDTVTSSKTDGAVKVLCKHADVETTVTKAATCTEAGVKTTVCKTCGKQTAMEEIPALGHKFADYVITKEATEEADGTIERTCSVCNKKVTTILAKLDKQNFSVLSGTGETFETVYEQGSKIIFTAVGIGMDNALPQIGDVRYVPAKWSINPSGEWTKAPYTAAFTIENVGEYELNVVYNREVYGNDGWKADGKTYATKTAVIINEKAAEQPGAEDGSNPDDAEKNSTQDNNAVADGSDNAVQTGDVAGATVVMLLMLAMISGGVFWMETKRRIVK